jgi:hypothetical protein
MKSSEHRSKEVVSECEFAHQRTADASPTTLPKTAFEFERQCETIRDMKVIDLKHQRHNSNPRSLEFAQA